MSAVNRPLEVRGWLYGSRSVRTRIRDSGAVSDSARGGWCVSSICVTRSFPDPRSHSTVCRFPGSSNQSYGVSASGSITTRTGPHVRPVNKTVGRSVSIRGSRSKVDERLRCRSPRSRGSPHSFSRRPSGNINGVSGVWTRTFARPSDSRSTVRVSIHWWSGFWSRWCRAPGETMCASAGSESL